LTSRIRCFIAMPFLPELNYFYLYLQHYLRETYGFHVERGDHSVAAGSILDKIRRQIQVAGLVIGDVSGSNPNVFYELGLADAYGAKIILITSGPVDQAPTDIRHLELIQYDLRRHAEFLAELGKAIHSRYFERYSELYEKALEFLHEFNSASGRDHDSASREQFQQNMMALEGRSGIPDGSDRIAEAEFLLLKVLGDPTDPVTLKESSFWLGSLDKSS
jgi:hypothetical protein